MNEEIAIGRIKGFYARCHLLWKELLLYAIKHTNADGYSLSSVNISSLSLVYLTNIYPSLDLPLAAEWNLAQSKVEKIDYSHTQPPSKKPG